MEDGIYLFIAQHIIEGVSFLLKSGLEKRLFDENYKKAKEEYRRQVKLYKSYEIAYRPSFLEIYENQKGKDKD
ncbi:MAG: hypothetical protein AABX83_01455 [Nanoarchaeota archaeon]